MRRCLELAYCGFPAVMPNPMVGAVIVSDGKIISEGFHHFFGGIHAEIDAINKITDITIFRKSILFVNLEPCSHYGKTPPCSQKIIECQIPEVVVATPDPNPTVNGKGIEQLKTAGIKVKTGILANQAIELNKRFFTFHRFKRPYIILKFAHTADGFIARPDYSSKWISNELSRQIVHKWRSEEMAVLVGKHTALVDNPRLNNRYSSKGNPVRVVIDRKNTLPSDLYIFNQAQKTLIYNELINDKKDNLEWIKIDFSHDVINQILTSLYEKNIQSLIVEGGKRTLDSFITSNLWDEARIFVSDQKFSEGIEAPEIRSVPEEEIKIKNDKLLIFQNHFYKIKTEI